MLVKNDILYKSKLIKKIKIDKFIGVASGLLNDLFITAQRSQWRTYKLNDIKGYERLTYTNNFNIVIDMIMRMTYLFNEMYSNLRKKYGVVDFIVFDDLGLLFSQFNESDYEKFETSQRYINIFDKTEVSGDSLTKRLIQDFVNWSRYSKISEEEDFDEMSLDLAQRYPYKFISYKEYKRLTPEIVGEKFELLKRKARYKFINTLSVIQCKLTIKEVKYIYEFFMYNLKANNVKNLNVMKVRKDFSEEMVFVLFPSSKIVFATNYYAGYDNAIYIHACELYYPYLYYSTKMRAMTKYSDKELLQYIVGLRDDIIIPKIDCDKLVIDSNYANGLFEKDTRVDEHLLIQIDDYGEEETEMKRSRHINTFEKLLKACETECDIGVFDANADYRYQFFENVKNLIVDEYIELILPDRLCDKDVCWVRVEDYIENLHEWIAQFNKFSKYVKLVLPVQ